MSLSQLSIVWHSICIQIENDIMLKIKKLHTIRDQHRIDVDDPTEIDCVHSMFPDLDTIEVVEAIQQVGPTRGKVLEYLKKYKATG